MADTVLVTSTRALLLACDELGLDTDSMLQAVGIARALIHDPDARLPIEQARACWEKAYELSEDPDLSLHAAERLPFGAYKVIDHMASQASTIGLALAHVSDYFPLINSAVHLPIEVGRSVATFGVTAPASPEILQRPYTEYILAAVVLRVRLATGLDFPLEQIEFMHPDPPSTVSHDRIFGCPLRFGSDACRMTIDRSVWDTPVPRADSSLLAVLEEHASLLLERVPQAPGLADQVRKTIAGELSGGDPSVHGVAKKLAMSPRTLQRRLAEDGWTYKEVLDDMRHGAAKAYLRQPDISISETAYLLGFADVGSLNRAFKRWAGCSPRDFRRMERPSAR
ncbi:MAG: AraC family transcriptional regulator [Myxococcota bacterium]